MLWIKVRGQKFPAQALYERQGEHPLLAVIRHFDELGQPFTLRVTEEFLEDYDEDRDDPPHWVEGPYSPSGDPKVLIIHDSDETITCFELDRITGVEVVPEG